MSEGDTPQADTSKNESSPATPSRKKTGGKASQRSAKRAKSARKPRTQRPYPAVPFSQAVALGDAIHQHASGQKVRRLTLLEKLQLSPLSSSTKMLITNSGKYGITKGGYNAEWLELTPEGEIATDPQAAPKMKLRARFDLAISGIPPLKLLYDEYVGKRLPATEVMRDVLVAADLAVSDYSECIDLFVTNVKDLGLLRTISAAQVLVRIEQAIEELGDSGSSLAPATTTTTTAIALRSKWDSICFYITPIGPIGSETRKHSDLFMTQIVEPALKELALEVIRADEIETSGMITTSILEHIKKARLVVADLSMANPNVYYEIALRHACRLPIVQIRRQNEDLPFDINHVKTITIDNTDLYSFVPQMDSFRAEIASLARSAIENPSTVSNPITAFYPAFWEGILS